MEAERIRQQYSDLPVQQIKAVPKAHFLKPSRAHGKANARGMTGIEGAEREANKAEATAKRVLGVTPPAQGTLEVGDTIEVVPDTPPRSGEVSPPEPSPSPSPPAVNLPPSTAPLRVETGRVKRARANTGYYAALLAGDS